MEENNMGQVRHGSATTTFTGKAAIQRLQTSIAELNLELSINPETVAEWRNRTAVKDTTVKRYHKDNHERLRIHLADFFRASKFARLPKAGDRKNLGI